MPSGKIHSMFSKERTGYNFEELHSWIDATSKEKGINHREDRHFYNLKDRKTIKDYWEKKKGKSWGEKAVVEWLFHIAIDNLETSYKEAKKIYGKNVYNFFKFGFQSDIKYIRFGMDRLEENELSEEFKEEYQ